MYVGLVDVDGHKFPNLALMRISAWHKAQGDHVEWWQGDLFYYDRVYMSKIFSSEYSHDVPDPINCGEVIKGGTGYCISLDENGKEVFDKSKNKNLPDEVERMFPDYSIYPQYNFAISMTSRGCPRGCQFCIVANKEGRCAHKVADVNQFWTHETGKKVIKVLDPNIIACRENEKRDLLNQYVETRCEIEFNQGIDIRMINENDIKDLNRMKIKMLHFAWDNPDDDLEDRFRMFNELSRLKSHGRKMVYCLTNFEDCSVKDHIERALKRIYILRSLNFDPFVMIYNKPSAPDEIKKLQRWCNNKIIFGKVKDFRDYSRKFG